MCVTARVTRCTCGGASPGNARASAANFGKAAAADSFAAAAAARTPGERGPAGWRPPAYGGVIMMGEAAPSVMYDAFGLIGTALSKKISVFHSSSKSRPDKPKRIV